MARCAHFVIASASMRVRTKQLIASSGVQTIGSVSLTLVLLAHYQFTIHRSQFTIASCSSSSRFTTLAGFPATTTPAGTARVTTLPAPTTLPRPIVTAAAMGERCLAAACVALANRDLLNEGTSGQCDARWLPRPALPIQPKFLLHQEIANGAVRPLRDRLIGRANNRLGFVDPGIAHDGHAGLHLNAWMIPQSRSTFPMPR